MKENKILKLIYVAWRERWTDSQFGINIKTVLPRGVSGDVYNLAECLIQQALIGSTANKLVLDHLKHSLCSHLVSHAAVIQSIAKFQKIERVYCVISLLDFLDSIMKGITCRSKPEESVLPSALVNLVLWLMRNVLSAAKYYEIRNDLSAERAQMLEKVCTCIEKIVSNEFLMIIYYIGSKDNPDIAKKIFEEYINIKSILTETNFIFSQLATEENLHKLAYLDLNHFVIPPMEPDNPENCGEGLAFCLQPLLSSEVCIHSSKEINYYVTELKMLQKLRRFSNTRLFYEIIRATFITINTSDETKYDIMWGAFSSLKMPQILKQLSDYFYASDPKAPTDYSTAMVEAFDMLFDDTMAVECFSSKYTEKICENFLNDWMTISLINEGHLKHFMSRREESELLQENSDTQSHPLAKLDKVPLSGILKTLSADYNKVQDSLLSVLNQVLVGNSFELILSVAMVEGHLKTFVSRLIQCNENSTPVPSDSSKQTTRSALFDVSFLMLTSIVQNYGTEVVLADTPGDTFFETWVQDAMYEKNNPKNYKEIVDACDEKIVDDILTSLSKPDTPINSSITWQDICKNIPAVIHNVLIAWETEVLTSADVKNILDNMKSQLFTYSVIATSFLCVYMDSVNENDFLKPLNMIQQFLTHPAAKTPASTPTPNEEEQTKGNLNERISLLYQIIKHFQQDSMPANNAKTLATTDPLLERFSEAWKEVKTLGWLPINTAKEFESLLIAAGPAFFVKFLVFEVTKCKYVGDMNKAMDIVFGIFHLDIEETTVAFLKEILPSIIIYRTGEEIYEPQTLVLARLAVHCIISCLEIQQLSSAQKKRLRSIGSDNEDNDSVNSAKQRKINPDGSENSCSNDFISDSALLLGTTSTNPATPSTTTPSVTPSLVTGSSSNDGISGGNDSNGKANSNDNGNSSLTNSNSNSNNNNGGTNTNSNSGNNINENTTLVLKEPLESAISFLFKALQSFVATDELSPKIIFVFQFISLLVEYGQERIRPVLRLVPANLIQSLLKLMLNDEIKVGLIARVYDLTTVSGRHQAVSDLCLLRNIHLRKTSRINL